MASYHRIRHGGTELEADEEKNQITITGPDQWGTETKILTTYEGARELLDCLMGIFGRHEIKYRYPEARY